MRDLARSGLVPEDMGTYPVDPYPYPAYCIPYPDPEIYRIRYDTNGPMKYMDLLGRTSVWYKQSKELLHSRVPLYLLEGEKKAAKFIKHFPELPAFGMAGTWSFAKDKKFLPDIAAALWPGRHVIAVYDSDVRENIHVRRAAKRLEYMLFCNACGFELRIPPIGKGADDWLVACPDSIIDDLVKVDLR